jgi:hypothetical protein
MPNSVPGRTMTVELDDQLPIDVLVSYCFRLQYSSNPIHLLSHTPLAAVEWPKLPMRIATLFFSIPLRPPCNRAAAEPVCRSVRVNGLVYVGKG